MDDTMNPQAVPGTDAPVTDTPVIDPVAPKEPGEEKEATPTEEAV